MSTNAAGTSQIVVAATFTATPLQDSLAFWKQETALPHALVFAPYGQLLQALLDPAGPFTSNTRGANIALFRIEDLAPQTGYSSLASHVDELLAALLEGARLSRVPLITSVCPPSSGFFETAEHQSLHQSLAAKIGASLKNQPNLYTICADTIVARYQVTDIEDRIAERTGRIPYHASFFAALGTEITRLVHALERKPVKVIAFDCDNTLWTGVCGEDGPQGVVIDAGRRALQSCLVNQLKAGVLLAIASKNNQADVEETFAAHPDMVLKWGDISAHRINWESKSRNLLEIAEELNLGLDSFAFLDDDAKECGEVCSETPEVATLRVPHESARLPRFLDHAWILDRPKPLTAEDRERSKRYAEQIERSRFERQAANLRDFLSGLRLEVIFAPVTPETIARAAQLTERTNQLNTSLQRYTERELEAALAAGADAFTVTVADRFGSYGLVGLVLLYEEADALRITGLMLSCRALGRGVENRMLAHAAEIARERGKRLVRIDVRRGPRNQPALRMLESAQLHGSTWADTELLEIDADTLLQLGAADPVSTGPAGETAAPATEPEPVPHIDYQRIADSLQTAGAILKAIDSRRLESASHRRLGTPPETKLQQRLASIWSNLLGVRDVGIDEDFFDLGGHSLLAVQLLSRIHQELGIELPDSVIYAEKLRIDNLARAIELQQLGAGDISTYESILAEVESLSDEEVAALLAQEEGNR